uniref:Fe2OG dioxygenase domain-containing protein n=1 Tax=Attheya septentrionalis TaxID=420275 RepID=A0A7S2UDG6_9STRA|mmetsp:Transcript_17987/g.32612  ORF Transcript_17987/g.32612 Transcript_17987/m.32612 type:complete len:390 (+) Transcript_17987:151-1320(+)|eukprot:CAMPEP_0198291028 /NCGR_PEP_ID=MMETSP1449-20131203/8691_1 /TAXON_ID=420275 /ORGANISM="Attheya septentrionalis, Strain CCMP2084" /LENGTH=389 /DNA_ID=CAMNT_0043989613 /DNA_START=60 /DNA_END=1229 /DNA_ORIENTATION=-
MATNNNLEDVGLVIVDYAEIVQDPLLAQTLLGPKLAQAFGSDGMGLIAIRNVPGFVASKRAVLPMAHTLAHLPEDYLESNVVNRESGYQSGWSRGKEMLGKVPDTNKGSFYFNPLTDQPGTPEDRAKYPASYPQNVWPSETVLPGFQDAAKQLGTLMHNVVVQLARHVDSFALEKCGVDSSNNPLYADPNLLYNAMRTTIKAKGRLLYYYPLPETSEDVPTEDSWIGWHNDSGFLTALAGDMYVDDTSGEEISREIDKEAGLYVTSRSGGDAQKVEIPFDCMGVQIGECVQIVTGGHVVATPHCVRGSRKPSMARISLPCFVDAGASMPLKLPKGCSREQVLNASIPNPHVPPLNKRWNEDGMEFGVFLHNTFSTYYDWQEEAPEENEE